MSFHVPHPLEMLPPMPEVTLGTICLVLIILTYFLCSFTELDTLKALPSTISTTFKFCYSCFLAPHTTSTSQQDALESFYARQCSIYDTTRAKLLKGREEMLGLCAAQLRFQAQQVKGPGPGHRKIWIDVGGGTGWNIETMNTYLSVPGCFDKVYLVDLSPSLCEVARARFDRLGWKNVVVVCCDASKFKLSDYEDEEEHKEFSIGLPAIKEEQGTVKADLLTMSYSLSMIPGFHGVVDKLEGLVKPTGILGVVDFYVQSSVQMSGRNYLGGERDRHCNFLSRLFWRTWFEMDRVYLDAARRDYLEYKFGTMLSSNARNNFFGFKIPYYVWIGCSKQTKSSLANLAALDAAATESPFINALDLQRKQICRPSPDLRSKAYESAIVNLEASLPLPSAWYQQHHWRIYYDEKLEKHTQFGDEYIYAFTWEDERVDKRLLKITSEDVILAITSAGDNILSYALERPKRIHAVDLNPNQNHLLELKVAAFTSLPYTDVWKLFGEGKHSDFHSLLINNLSPHLSSQAFDHWLHKGPATFSPHTRGLYNTGGSRHALTLIRYLGTLLGITTDIRALCTSSTLNEQRELWHTRLRRVILSKFLSYTIIASERFLWKALGVPPSQLSMIETDHRNLDATGSGGKGQAVWEYAVNTLDPVIQNTLIAQENPYYLICLRGEYTPVCHPAYLAPRAHTRLAATDAFDGLRIHTDELCEVMKRMSPGTLTIAVFMDSMDWFDPKETQAWEQVCVVNRALKMGGRVLLRSAGLKPWYIGVFEKGGFGAKRVGVRTRGVCVDRVNMYASTWICTKVGELGDVEVDGVLA